MKVTILLKNGRKCEYPNANIQKINEGTSVAIYDTDTFRIIAQYKADQISMCQSSTGSHSKQAKTSNS